MDSPHRENLLHRPTDRPLTSREVHDLSKVKEFEKRQWELDRLKKQAVAHRVAGSSKQQRLSSWVADKSEAQMAFEAAQLRKYNAKAARSVTERIHADRQNKVHNKKIDAFENQKKL